MTSHPVASLAWTLDPDKWAAWINACNNVPALDHVGDTGADHGPSEADDVDGDRRADADENRRWRTLP